MWTKGVFEVCRSEYIMAMFLRLQFFLDLPIITRSFILHCPSPAGLGFPYAPCLCPPFLVNRRINTIPFQLDWSRHKLLSFAYYYP
jgi:hypothetical protein